MIICPCQSEKKYENCCKILHAGGYPKNALALMRSRYSAYFFHLAEYIIRTTHPDNPNYKQNHSLWIQEILYFCQNTKFQNLEILEFIDGNEKAYVTFKVHLIQANLKKELLEKSYFEKIGNQWLYRDAVSIKIIE